jgi:hypothetical protein
MHNPKRRIQNILQAQTSPLPSLPKPVLLNLQQLCTQVTHGFTPANKIVHSKNKKFFAKRFPSILNNFHHKKPLKNKQGKITTRRCKKEKAINSLGKAARPRARIEKFIQ